MTADTSRNSETRLVLQESLTILPRAKASESIILELSLLTAGLNKVVWRHLLLLENTCASLMRIPF